eukprot:284454_1
MSGEMELKVNRLIVFLEQQLKVLETELEVVNANGGFHGPMEEMLTVSQNFMAEKVDGLKIQLEELKSIKLVVDNYRKEKKSDLPAPATDLPATATPAPATDLP